MATLTKRIGANNAYEIRLIVTENSRDLTANTTNVTVRFAGECLSTYSGAYNLNDNNTITLTVGGNVVFKTTKGDIDFRRANGEYTLASWTGNVKHDSNGKLTLQVSGSFLFNATSAASLPRATYTISGTVAITDIPQLSLVYATDVLATSTGAHSVITIVPASPEYRHTVTYRFVGEENTYTGTIAAKTASTTIDFPLPTEFIYQLPRSKNLPCTITCETFDGNTSRGTHSTTFNVIGETNIQLTGLTVQEGKNSIINLMGRGGLFLRGYSVPVVRIDARSATGAYIANYSINGTVNKINGNQGSLGVSIPWDSTPDAFNVTVEDTRGNRAGDSVAVQYYDFTELTSTATYTRENPTSNSVAFTISGVAQQSFPKASNAITVSFKFRKGADDWSTLTATTPSIGSDGKYLQTYSAPMDYRYGYEAEITISDKLKTITLNVSVPQGIPVFDWGASDFCFNVPISVNGKNMADFVIASGHDSATDVDYRQWESGFAEIWFRSTEDASISTNSGGCYQSQTITKRLPFKMNYAVAAATCSGGCWALTQAIADTTFEYRLCRMLSASSLSVTSRFYITGRWKSSITTTPFET